MVKKIPQLTRPSLQTWTRQLRPEQYDCAPSEVCGCERHIQDDHHATSSNSQGFYLATFAETRADYLDSPDRTGASVSAKSACEPFGISV